MTQSPDGNEPGEYDDAALDQRLKGSDPARTPVTPELRMELSRISGEAREEASGKRRAKRLGLSRGAALGLAALMVFGGGAAAVAVVEIRNYWDNLGTEPHGGYSFELPSGAVCEVEHRIMDSELHGPLNESTFVLSDEQDELAQQIYADAQGMVDEIVGTTELDERIVYEAEFPGREDLYLTDDALYFHAVTGMVDRQIYDAYRDEMNELGIGGGPMGHSCPGADFEGTDLEQDRNMDAFDEAQEVADG